VKIETIDGKEAMGERDINHKKPRTYQIEWKILLFTFMKEGKEWDEGA